MSAYLLPLLVLMISCIVGAPIFIAAVVFERKLRMIHKRLLLIHNRSELDKPDVLECRAEQILCLKMKTNT